jgi:hypothetical protein
VADFGFLRDEVEDEAADLETITGVLGKGHAMDCTQGECKMDNGDWRVVEQDGIDEWSLIQYLHLLHLDGYVPC